MKCLVLSSLFLIVTGCGTNLSLTPFVPDFQLNETRKYTPISERQQSTRFEKTVPLETVSGMYCFPKEEVAALVKEWRRRNNPKNNKYEGY